MWNSQCGHLVTLFYAGVGKLVKSLGLSPREFEGSIPSFRTFFNYIHTMLHRKEEIRKQLILRLVKEMKSQNKITKEDLKDLCLCECD